MTRPVVLDVSSLFIGAPDFVGVGLARSPLGQANPVRVKGGRVRIIEPAEVRTRLESLDRAATTAGARASGTLAWLLGAPASPHLPNAPPRRAGGCPAVGSNWTNEAPSGAVVLKPGFSGWSDPAVTTWLATRPDLAAVALVDHPVALEAPQYCAPEAAARLRRDLAAIARFARAIVAPSETARTRIAAALGRPDLPIHVRPWPSRLAGSRPVRHDPDLAAAPYWVAPLPVEAGRNTTLLLTVWRDMIHKGLDVPKLVLAGARGRQIEQIRPLLEWCETLRPFVREAPHMSPTTLRLLVGHAQGVLLPAFTDETGALARDLATLGARVVASDIPIFLEALAGRGQLLSPIDGPGWREVVSRRFEPATCGAGAVPDWAAFCDGVGECLANL
ncbi:MAG: hypothetical protein ABR878_06290 [Roseiarcus sp.]